MKVRDKLWLFASRAHDDDIFLGKSTENRFTRWSRITPAEGAAMLDVPNVIMIGSDGDPAPFSAEAYGYMESFCRMKNVVWSVTGSAGFRTGTEEKFICELVKRYPNVVGAFADDFYEATANLPASLEEKLQLVRDIRRQLDTAQRPLSMWLTVYTKYVADLNPAMVDVFDTLTLWDMAAVDFDHYRESFELLEQRFPDKKRYVGVYLYRYGIGEPTSNEYLAQQCEFGLQMLKEGRADGIIFLTNCVMGVGLPSEYFIRDWIDNVKDQELSIRLP